MRILRRIHLAGLVALAGAAGVADEAKANDVTISTTTSTPVATSAPDTVSPGDVTIANGGNIQITTGETAVTVDSNNDVTVESGGQITATDEDGVVGIALENGFAGTITNSGSISLVEDYDQPDTGSDGDLDGPVAIGINRIAIWQQGDFTGDIVNTGNINVEGNTSYGIRLDGQLGGDLNHTGSITLVGSDGAAVAVLGGAAGGVTGDLRLRGTVTAHGENSFGALIDAPIGGELRVNGVWTGTGYNSTVRLSGAAAANLDADDFLQSAAVLEVRFSVAGGITIEGVGVEDDVDDDNDGLTEAGGDTDDDLTASMRSFSSAPTIHLIADSSANLVLGNAADGYGLNIRGGVFADSIFDGFSATALRIEGQGGRIVDTGAGVRNDNFMSAQGYEANAYTVYLGAGALVPEFVNRRSMSSVSISETDQTAYVIYVAPSANLGAITNSGYMRSQVFGELGDSVVIRDLSNSLATITNSGQILAQVIATDADPLDGVPPPAVTGSAIAIDVSASTIGVTYNQIADVVFNDDDTVDDDSATRPPTATTGDILFGSGGDTINLLDGTIDGAVSFGDGADLFHIDGGFYFGRVTDSDGALSFDVSNGGLVLNGGTLNITQAHFGADGQLGVVLSTVPSETTFINAAGTVTFDPGASITPIIPNGLPVSGVYDFLTAGALVGATNVVRTISGSGTPYLYNLAVQVDPGDVNTLQAVFALKTPAELGLNPNQSIAFDPIINALRLDAEAAQAMSLIDNQYDFNDAYEDLLPTFSSATTELSATAIQQMQSATTNRLTTIRVQDIDEVSVWAQEIGYALNREPQSTLGQDFRGYGFGLAAGIDGPLDNGALFGLSVSFITSEMEEPGRPEGQISTTFAQGNAYLGTAFGPVDLDFVGGLGAGRMSERRFVEIGDAFSAITEADWWAFEGHGAVRASVPLRMGWLVMTPQTALTYVGISEQDYEESGGGAAIDYRADTVFSQRLWADVGVDFAARWNLRGGTIVSPHIYAGYRGNLIDQAADRTFTFVSTGETFTLTDEELGSGGPLVGLGIDATNGYSTFSLTYEGEFTDQIERHSLNAAIRFRF